MLSAGTFPPGNGPWRGRCSSRKARWAGAEKKLSSNDERLKPSEQNAISKARYLLRLDEALAQSVMSGAVSLNAAYDAAKAGTDARDRAAQEERERRKMLRNTAHAPLLPASRETLYELTKLDGIASNWQPYNGLCNRRKAIKSEGGFGR